MARPRTPTNILDARGAFKHNPGRRKDRANEPVGLDPVGDPPASFTEDQKKAWNDIVNRCAKGVLTIADSISVEIAAGLLARHRMMPLMGSDLSQLNAMLGKYGMNPADRSKVSGLGPEKKKNRFADLG